jgi:hypothetical protein
MENYSVLGDIYVIYKFVFWERQKWSRDANGAAVEERNERLRAEESEGDEQTRSNMLETSIVGDERNGHSRAQASVSTASIIRR